MSDRIQREQEFHDKRFTEPSERSQRVSRFYRLAESVQNDYRQLLAQQKAQLILEYGCGTKNYAFDLAHNGTHVHGIDISAVALNLARSSIETEAVSFSQMNAERLAVANNAFDLVCGTGILHHLQLESALHEIARILKPGGQAIFIEPLGHNIFINAFRRLTPSIRTEDEHPLVARDLDLFRQFFGNVSVRYYYLTTLALSPLVNLSIFPALLKASESFDQMLFKLPILQKQAWQILIQLSKPKT